MELRQQVTLGFSETKKALIAHVEAKGVRLLESSVKINKDGTFFALTMSENEIYIADTLAALNQPLRSLEIKNKDLLKKLLTKLGFDAKVKSLLMETLPDPGYLSEEMRMKQFEKFRSNNYLSDKLYYNSPKKRDKLKSAEEEQLIKIFSDLKIVVQKKI